MLDARLRAIASLVRPGEPICDVGTDHGYLPAWLVASGISPRAVACDIQEKPLAAARRTVEGQGLAERVKLLLSDGLANVPPEQARDVIIAGMGGELIARILGDCPWAREAGRRFLLQPMTRTETLRAALCQMGFGIERELPVWDGTHRYTVIQAAFTGESTQPGELFLRVGRIPEEKTPEAAKWLRAEAAREQKIADGLSRKANGGEEAARRRKLAGQIETLAKEGTAYADHR